MSFAGNKLHGEIAKPVLVAFLAAVLLCLSLAAQAPERGPDQFADVSARAAQARDAGNLQQAIALYGQATQLRPDWQEGWWYLGMLRYSADQYPAAIDAFNHLLQLAPTAAPAMALRGLCEFETAQYDDALRDLEQAVAHGAANDPRNAQILRFHLAQLLTRAGRFPDALAQYAFFAREKVDSADLDASIGMAGMHVAAFLRDASAGDRVIYEAAGHAAWPLMAGDSVEADARFRQFFARYPSTPNLHYMYGFLLYPHDPGMAIEQFEKELAVKADNTAARAMLAYSLMIAGRFAEARTEAERVLAAAPEMETAQIAEGRALVETGEGARGEAMLKQVLVNDPNNMEAHLGLVSLYSRMGRKEDAQRERMACLRLIQ